MARIEVNLWSGLRRFTDGETAVTVEAGTVGEMLEALKAAYPGLAPVLDDGVSVAVDGEVLSGGRHEPLSPDSEIYLMQRLRGG
jgi:molybdopterin converting factor small subunit